MCEYDLVIPMTSKCRKEWDLRNGTCTFTPDCKKATKCQRIADAYCKCNHGQCVTVGLHASLWIDPNITRDCDEGGYMDCACKYALLLHIFVHMKVLSIFRCEASLLVGVSLYVLKSFNTKYRQR